MLEIIAFHSTHKIRYLNLEYYRDSAYVVVEKNGRMRGYLDEVMVSDRESIDKIVDYLQGIPLVHKYRYFKKSTRELIIPELEKNRNNSSAQNESFAFVVFYNSDDTPRCSIEIYAEKYVIDGRDTSAYKAKDEEALIISGLETLKLK